MTHCVLQLNTAISMIFERQLARQRNSSEAISAVPNHLAANLAIEEIVTNLIKYGYDDFLKHKITVRLNMTEKMLNSEICDDGAAFNPFNQPERDTRFRPKSPESAVLA